MGSNGKAEIHQPIINSSDLKFLSKINDGKDFILFEKDDADCWL